MAEKFRLQLDVTPAVLAQIDALKERTHATSRAETIRYALRTLQWLEKASKAGRVLVADRAGTRQVVFPFLESAATAEGSAKSEMLLETADALPETEGLIARAQPVGLDANTIANIVTKVTERMKREVLSEIDPTTPRRR